MGMGEGKDRVWRLHQVAKGEPRLQTEKGSGGVRSGGGRWCGREHRPRGHGRLVSHARVAVRLCSSEGHAILRCLQVMLDPRWALY